MYGSFNQVVRIIEVLIFSSVTIFGLVYYADKALLSHEKDLRVRETALRREARIDLAKRGLVGTETEIARWKEEREARLKQSLTSDNRSTDS